MAKLSETEAIDYHINGLCYVAWATPGVDHWHRKFSDIAFPFKYRICCTQYYYQTPLSNGFRRGRFQSLVTLKCTYWHTCGHSKVFYVWKYRTGILVLGKQFLFIYTVPGKNGNHTYSFIFELYPPPYPHSHDREGKMLSDVILVTRYLTTLQSSNCKF